MGVSTGLWYKYNLLSKKVETVIKRSLKALTYNLEMFRISSTSITLGLSPGLLLMIIVFLLFLEPHIGCFKVYKIMASAVQLIIYVRVFRAFCLKTAKLRNAKRTQCIEEEWNIKHSIRKHLVSCISNYSSFWQLHFSFPTTIWHWRFVFLTFSVFYDPDYPSCMLLNFTTYIFHCYLCALYVRLTNRECLKGGRGFDKVVSKYMKLYQKIQHWSTFSTSGVQLN